MPDFVLDGSSGTIDLGMGVRLTAPGLVGQGRTREQRPLGLRSAGGEMDAFDQALRDADIQETLSVEIDATAVPPSGAAAGLRAPNGDDALEIEVPDTGPQWEHVVLAVDEGGAMSWHFPLTTDGQIASPAVRGGGGATKRFRIPRTIAPMPSADQAATRGLIGSVGRKLLKVLVYPVTDLLIGGAVELFAGRWEGKKRPYGVRLMTPDNFAQPNVASLSPEQWRQLGAGRALLFIHGTFSTAHGGFGGLSRDDMSALNQRYGGRVFAFDHRTLSHGPAENAREFAQRLPDDVSLDLDIVSHSRGGLVTRELVERQAGLGLAPGRLRVGRAIFVGVPNAGTLLTDPDHMVHMVDRFTSVTNIFPTGPVTEFLEALLTVVKVIGHGGLKSLDGLAAMRPNGDYLKGLVRDGAGQAEYLAVTADFEPGDGPLSALVKARVKNAIMDRIFEGEANDLVVPTASVFSENGSAAFPIVKASCLRLPQTAGVVHTQYFQSAETRRVLRDWLPGS